jgi:hypothetical protein
MAIVHSEVISEMWAMTQRITDMVACADIEVVASVRSMINNNLYANEDPMGIYHPRSS